MVAIHSGKGARAKEKLEEAVRDGDADACYFLGRCYAGRGFISPEHGLPEDDVLASGSQAVITCWVKFMPMDWA